MYNHTWNLLLCTIQVKLFFSIFSYRENWNPGWGVVAHWERRRFPWHRDASNEGGQSWFCGLRLEPLSIRSRKKRSKLWPSFCSTLTGVVGQSNWSKKQCWLDCSGRKKQFFQTDSVILNWRISSLNEWIIKAHLNVVSYPQSKGTR